ncbi:glutamyl-tRNA amidotransferase [Nibricoccus aquaticus]|uniref:Glutamyl-tRNA amidotransferase n=1 Tax=Nibricoccus aquaticus TaxID=2576891 RepID=A0A290QHG8_9BACT|nr:amidase family protein [Nibricoccus aquaticus]ATC64788.1 glutamyl-tRNA amidotransferase [Nibricoccus aquaticus]
MPSLFSTHQRTLIRRLTFALGCAFAAPFLSSSYALDLETATIADLEAAMAKGTLTSEKLTSAYLARIAAYDKQGPTLNTVITLNPKALDQAKALDAERKSGKIRGPLHGIPIVLKDNFDTFDLPTTAGSQLLAGSIAPDDAFVVKKLRDSGAIILAKLNLSEFAGGGGSVSGAKDPAVLKAGAVPNGSSSLGGQTLNPHDLTRGPAGSSGGTGSAIAAVFAQFGLGSDTGGSVRGPSAANGIVGLKPTHGLLSRDGIVPLALTFDTGGPMARNVYDIAVSLNVMTGVDSHDDATKKSAGKFEKDYTKFLKPGSLKGARIGVARDFTGKNPETDRVFNEALATLTKLGATVIDVNYPAYLLEGRGGIYSLIMATEFKAQITDYLKTTSAKYPKTFDDLVTLANDPKTGYKAPGKAYALKYTASVALDIDDPVYLAAKNEGLALITAAVLAVFKNEKLDAIVYPTGTRPAALIESTTPPAPTGTTDSATSIANLTGFPDLIVPAGMTKDGLPVTLSFFGPAFSEAKLLGYGYDFEQATKAIVLPKTTPALPSDKL